MSKEAALQKSCVAWFRHTYPEAIIYHIPNGGFRNVREASNLKHMGVLAGIPDLFIAVCTPDYGGLYIEMKDPDKKGTLSSSQRYQIDRLTESGYRVEICDSPLLFKTIIESYLGY